jgi:hypothetical protein
MRPQKPVIVMPGAHDLHNVYRALKRIPSPEVALVLPASTPDLAAVTGLDQVLTWATEQGKDVTIIGGSPQARAEAVLRGLRVATSVDAWEAWLAAAKNAAAELTQRIQSHGDDPGWRIIHPAQSFSGDDEMPAYVSALQQNNAVPMPVAAGDGIPADERYEDAIIALIWQTGKLTGEMPAIDG